MRVSFLIVILGFSLAALGQDAKDKPKFDPFANPVEEMAKRAERAAKEKRYDELKAAASDLVELSRVLSEEIAAGNKDVISVKVLQNLDKAEKLIKSMRDKAK